MTCGDSVPQWVPAIVGSVYSGEIGSASGDVAVVMVLSPVTSLAVVTIGGVAHTGAWTLQSGQLLCNVALNGSQYNFTLSATTCAGTPARVTVADGSVADPFAVGYAAHLEMVL